MPRVTGGDEHLEVERVPILSDQRQDGVQDVAAEHLDPGLGVADVELEQRADEPLVGARDDDARARDVDG